MDSEKGQENTVTRFIYMGDPQCERICRSADSYRLWSHLLDVAQARAGEDALLVLGGDLVNRGGGDAEWAAFSRAVAARRGSGSVVSVAGNCDRKRHGTHNFFSFDYGQIHFLMLDSNYMGSPDPAVWAPIRRWIREDTAHTDRPVRIAVLHHPLYTVGSALDDDVRAAVMRRGCLDLFRSGGISMVLCGHQHLYCRCGIAGGITQLIGVSGTKYFDGPAMDRMEVAAVNVSTASILETDGKRLCLTTIDPAGSVLDHCEKMIRQPVYRPPQVTASGTACPAAGEARSGPWLDHRDAPAASLRETGNLPVTSLPQPAPGILRLGGVGFDGARYLSHAVLSGMPARRQRFSLRRRGRLCHVDVTGVPLFDVLGRAGWNGTGDGLLLGGRAGASYALPLQALLDGRCFETDRADAPVVPVIAGEAEGLRLYAGQTDPGQYNGKAWMHALHTMEVIDLSDMLNETGDDG